MEENRKSRRIKCFLSIARFHQNHVLAISSDLEEVDGLLPSNREECITYLQQPINAIFAKALFNSSQAIVSLVKSNQYSGNLIDAQLPYFYSAATAGASAALPILAFMHISRKDWSSACSVLNEGMKKREMICTLLMGVFYQTGVVIAVPKGSMRLNKNIPKAIRLLECVVNAGKRCGYRELGLFLYTNDPTKERAAINYLKLAAEKKDPKAYKILLDIYVIREELELANIYFTALKMLEEDAKEPSLLLF